MSDNQDSQNNNVPTQESATDTQAIKTLKYHMTQTAKDILETPKKSTPPYNNKPFIKNIVNAPLNQIIADVQKRRLSFAQQANKKTVGKTEVKQNRKMLAQQIIFWSFSLRIIVFI